MIWAAVPTKTDVYAERLLSSMEVSEPGSLMRTVLADNGLSTEFRLKWGLAGFTIAATPFCFAEAINMAIKQFPPAADIVIFNDDVKILTPFWRTEAERVLKLCPTYGLIAMAIQGGVGNPEQSVIPQSRSLVTPTQRTLCFVAVIIRREAWDAVGPLDERFIGYGFEDDDFCRRLRDGGWATGVTQRLSVEHGGFNEIGYSSTYRREHSPDVMHLMFHQNRDRYIEKWGAPPT